MLEMSIDEKACRGCELCLDVCPTDCFSFDTATAKATVKQVQNCIACLSCTYICPSHAIEHSKHHVVKNFYRNLEFSTKISKFI